MSSLTPTLELDLGGLESGASAEIEPAVEPLPGVPEETIVEEWLAPTDDAPVESFDEVAPPVVVDAAGAHEAEPTTLTIPVVSGAEAVVLDEAPSASPSALAGFSPRRAYTALTLLATGAFALGAFEASVVALTPQIAAGLNVPVASVGLLVTAFALTVVVTVIPLTVATKRWRKRASLAAAFATWTVGVLLAATASGLMQLAASRVVSGAAHALFWAIVAPTAAALFAPHLRARTVTGIMLGAAAAGVLGTPVVTATGTALGWQVPYYGLAALGLVLAIAVPLALPTQRGVATTSHTIGDLPSRRTFLRVMAVTLIAAVGMSATWTFIVPFFTKQAGLPIASLPLVFALGGTIAVAATMGVTPYLARRPVHTVGVGTALLSVAWAFLALGYGWSALAAQALQAAGWAILVAALLNWSMRHTPWRSEVGAGVFTMTFNVGIAAGPLLGGLIVAMWSTRALPLVSLGLTLVAGAVVARVDATTIRKLRIPRHVRARLAEEAALRRRRNAWWLRTHAKIDTPRLPRSARRAKAEKRARASARPANRHEEAHTGRTTLQRR